MLTKLALQLRQLSPVPAQAGVVPDQHRVALTAFRSHVLHQPGQRCTIQLNLVAFHLPADHLIAGIIGERYEYTYAVRAVKDGHTGLASDRVKLRRGLDEDGDPLVEITIDSLDPP